ncbi:hypothetical protein JKP88DRAFT_266148, partial [Tribonema minus]
MEDCKRRLYSSRGLELQGRRTQQAELLRLPQREAGPVAGSVCHNRRSPQAPATRAASQGRGRHFHTVQDLPERQRRHGRGSCCASIASTATVLDGDVSALVASRRLGSRICITCCFQVAPDHLGSHLKSIAKFLLQAPNAAEIAVNASVNCLWLFENAFEEMHVETTLEEGPFWRLQKLKQGALEAMRMADARVAKAQLEANLTKLLAVPGYTVVRRSEGDDCLSSIVEELLKTLPELTEKEVTTKWSVLRNNVLNCRYHMKLFEMVKGRYLGAKNVVMNKLSPYNNDVLFGNRDRAVHKPSFLLSRKTEKADALGQGPHRDWVLNQILDAQQTTDGCPVGIIISLQDGGAFHLWPNSHDAQEVRANGMMKIQFNAGDILLFHGALVREGAGYELAEGEQGWAYHLRLHFYLRITIGKDNAWEVDNQFELVPLIE